MNADWPAEIVVTETPSGVLYRLPRRDDFVLRVLGWTLLGTAVLYLSLPVVTRLIQIQRGFDVVALFRQIASVSPVAAFFVVIRSYLLGNCDIAVENGTLTVSNYGLLMPWRRRRPVEQIKRISLRFGREEPRLVTHPRAAPETNDKENTCTLEVTFAKEPSLSIGFGYPARLLWPLALDLNRRITMPAAPGLATDGTVTESPARPPLPPVEIVCGRTPTFVERPDQPTGSNATLERTADALTITMPPPGIVKGSKGLFAFTVIWNGFFGLMATLSLGSLFGGNAGKAFPAIIIFGLMWLIGMVFGAICYHMGRRRAVLAVVGETLLTLQTGPLGEKRGEWDRDELADIRPGPSGMTVNKKPVLELHIQPIDGKCFGILGGRDVEELEWIATILRQTLRVPVDDQAPVSSEEDGCNSDRDRT